jgi:hypothetical protein
MANGNTDPATFVSIGQDPDKPEGWNVVTLSDGQVWKFGGIVERDENGLVVQRIALTENKIGGEIGPDGPVITPEIALAIEAVGGTVGPIHETKIIPPTAEVDPKASIPVTLTQVTPSVVVATVPGEQVHESLLRAIESHVAGWGRAAEAEAKALIAKLRDVFEAAKAKL